MIYRLTPRKCRDVKSIVDAETKKAAVCYFAALMQMEMNDLLKIYKIR